MLDETHDPLRRSWVASANEPGCEFPIQNLPLGVFRRRGSGEAGRIGVAIGDQVLDLNGLIGEKLLGDVSPETACALSASTLNAFMAQGRESWRAARRAIGQILDADAAIDEQEQVRKHLVTMADVEMLLPAAIGDYTDFYASIHHATNVGSMFRPDNPLLPNYRHLPVGYHGRASSIVVSGTPIRRPTGQTKADDAAGPVFGPCRLLDYEMELGVFVGPGNAMGTRISVDEADEQLFGVVIVNDWSARDVQKWEYQPLGPFNAKNFATSIGGWVVTAEALAPFRKGGPEREAGSPEPLAYLKPGAGRESAWSLAITVEVLIASKAMREAGMPAMLVSSGNFADMYWTFAQMLAHHTSTGCNMRAGDLLASGTISGPGDESRGCLLERTWRGERPLQLPDGTQRKFLQDGDEVIMRAFAGEAGSYRVGFGACSGVVESAC